jgi:hypothetical protein
MVPPGQDPLSGHRVSVSAQSRRVELDTHEVDDFYHHIVRGRDHGALSVVHGSHEGSQLSLCGLQDERELDESADHEAAVVTQGFGRGIDGERLGA